MRAVLTLLLTNGVDVKSVQTRLGHASTSITLDWCAHVIPKTTMQQPPSSVFCSAAKVEATRHKTSEKHRSDP